jgi:hypothetical protein
MPVDGQFVERLIYEHCDTVPLSPLPSRWREVAGEAHDREMIAPRKEFENSWRLESGALPGRSRNLRAPRHGREDQR